MKKFVLVFSVIMLMTFWGCNSYHEVSHESKENIIIGAVEEFNELALTESRMDCHEETKKWLESQKDISNAEIIDSSGIVFEYSDKTGGILITEIGLSPEDTAYSGSLLPFNTELLEGKAVDALIIDPFYWQWTTIFGDIFGWDPCDEIDDMISENGGWSYFVRSETYGDPGFTIADFLELAEDEMYNDYFDLIFMFTHGKGKVKLPGEIQRYVTLSTSEMVTEEKAEEYEWMIKDRMLYRGSVTDWDLAKANLIKTTWGPFFTITPKFIEYYFPKGFENTMIVACACWSGYDNTMAEAFLGNYSGNSCYLGWKFSVHQGVASTAMEELINQTVNEGVNLRTALDTLDQKGLDYDPRYKSSLQTYGSSNFEF